MALRVGTQHGGSLGLLVAAQTVFVGATIHTISATVQPSAPTTAMVAGHVKHILGSGVNVQAGSPAVSAQTLELNQVTASVTPGQPDISASLVWTHYVD